jgi:Protein of unknown function (DUF1084)
MDPLLAIAETAVALTGRSSWWEDVDNSATWQDRIYYSLSALYGLIGAVALVSLKILNAIFSKHCCSEKGI